MVTILRDRFGQKRARIKAELNRYLQPNRWVQSNDPVIADFAQVGRWGDSIDQRMSLLVKAVAERIIGRIQTDLYR